uniref:Uncharacterized protein n=1 Tax=Streptomyces sp. F12 TaxID=1436084 RepID=V9Z8M8_9ACTN|nr:hypothetical protein [Streptomyces sp. F12]AHE40478.1 hypothetical protein pFRL6_391c [Streptomyces sp. F12]
MTDYRAYAQVVQCHIETWIQPLTTQNLDMHGGDSAATLRAAHEWPNNAYGDLATARGEIWHAVAAALGRAARVAEAVAADVLNPDEGEQQVLAALNAAETLDGLACGRQ